MPTRNYLIITGKAPWRFRISYAGSPRGYGFTERLRYNRLVQEAAAPSTEQGLAGFLLSGFLLALLGAVLPAWGYYRDPPQFAIIGNYFLGLAVGVIGSMWLSPRLVAWKDLRFRLVFSCALGSAGLVGMALATPPASWIWRLLGLVVIGLAVGLLNHGLFHTISPSYRRDPARTANRAGIYYGLGCLAVTLLAAGTFNAYTVPAILIFMAVAPGLYAGVYARTTAGQPAGDVQTDWRKVLGDFRSLAAVLFALIVFFQFGNEWSIAGWLPLFLVRRLGISPQASLLLLAVYWAALLVGRIVAVPMLPRIRHARLLEVGVLSAAFGCMLLALTNNRFGAATGVVLLGWGFASIYPLLAEKIGSRFPYYHPVFFSGIFSLALCGGLLAPATLGYAAAAWGIGVVIALPLLGTVMVCALLLLVWLESKITGR